MVTLTTENLLAVSGVLVGCGIGGVDKSSSCVGGDGGAVS